MDRVSWLENTLRSAFAPEHLEVIDDGARHVGHAEAGSGGHYCVVIVSGRFRNRDLLSRQRAVYAALGAGMQSEIHALSLRTLTPEEWTAGTA
ncbi:MAG: BolA family protein [Candidatus Binatia bacterium]